MIEAFLVRHIKVYFLIKVRECSKRIMELAEDRPKLREVRKKALKLRKNIEGASSFQGSANKKGSKNEKKRWMINEDAFYNRTSSKSKKKGKSKTVDSVSLAKKLGLDEDILEQAKKIQQEKDRAAKDSKYAKAKQEQDVSIFGGTADDQKEIDEVKAIIEEGNMFDQYIEEIDLLGEAQPESEALKPESVVQKGKGGLLPPPPTKKVTGSPQNSPSNQQNQDLDLLGMNIDQNPSPQIQTSSFADAQPGQGLTYYPEGEKPEKDEFLDLI